METYEIVEFASKNLLTVGEPSTMTFEWYSICFSLSILGIEQLALKWIQWAGWTGGIGEGIFVLLAIITAVRWRMPFSLEQRKVRKISLCAIGFGMAVNLYILSFASGLSH